MNCLISFTPNDFANLEYLKNLSNNDNKKQEIDELIAKIKSPKTFKEYYKNYLSEVLMKL